MRWRASSSRLRGLGALLLLVVAVAGRLARAATSQVACLRKYSEFLPSIFEDLLPYERTGITEDHLERMMADVFQREPYRGASIGIAILNNTVYVMNGDSDETAFGSIPTCGGFDNLITYLRALDALADLYKLPDVEFVISQRDMNEMNIATATIGVSAKENERRQLPIFRYARSDAWDEILIPNYHIYEWHSHVRCPDIIDQANAKHPWRNRTGLAFGGHTCFPRGMDEHYTLRLDRDGQRLAMDHSPRALLANLSQWAPNGWDAKDKLWVTCDYHPGLDEWAQYKYVVHVDGLGWSDKIFTLMMTGSCILLEQSGYRSFFGRQLRPFVHYVPFWKTRPQELADAVEWARSHDEQCEEIGKEAQRFAARFFTVDSLRCYWLLLLQNYARLQRFTPGKRRNPPSSLVEAKAYVARARKIEKEKPDNPYRAVLNEETDWVY